MLVFKKPGGSTVSFSCNYNLFITVMVRFKQYKQIIYSIKLYFVGIFSYTTESVSQNFQPFKYWVNHCACVSDNLCFYRYKEEKVVTTVM